MGGERRWSLQVASDVIRDGLGVELLEASRRVRAEVFRCDADHTVTVSHFDGGEPVPPEVLDWYYAEAARRLEAFEDGSPLPERSAWRSVQRAANDRRQAYVASTMRDKGAGIGCLGVDLGAEGAAEWVDGQRVVFVPRDRIVAVELRRGIVGERPVLQVVFGLVAVVLGLALLSSLAGLFESTWLWGSARMAAAGAPLAVLGGYVLWSGVRPGYYLLVRTSDDARKLLFHGKIDFAEVSRALHAAHARFGYAVEWNIQRPRPPLAPFR